MEDVSCQQHTESNVEQKQIKEQNRGGNITGRNIMKIQWTTNQAVGPKQTVFWVLLCDYIEKKKKWFSDIQLNSVWMAQSIKCCSGVF